MSVKDAVHDEFEGVYDVCIIGSGPVGLTLCAELAELTKTGKRICVLESGGEKKTPDASSLNDVENDGEVVIKRGSRERILGGTSTVWSGLSAPLDEIDMSSRPFLSYTSTWPVSYKELASCYTRAEQYGFPPIDIYSGKGLEAAKKANELTIQSAPVVEKIFAEPLSSVNFAKNLEHLFSHPGIDVFCNATVTRLVSKKDEGGLSRVTEVQVQSPNKKTRTVSAHVFILATGGIETSRLLLLSLDTCQQGLGNEHDQVGRYIMNHPKKSIGILKLARPARSLPYFFGAKAGDFFAYAGFRLSDKLQKEKQVLNSYLRFEPVYPWEEVGAGISAFIAHIMYKLFKKEPSVTRIKLRNFMEMEPQASNRITLGKTLDVYGNPLPKVTLNTSDLDRRSLVELHKVLAEEVAKGSVGTLEGDLEKATPWPVTTEASHHLGGARMGLNPKSSVVDSDLRVHSVTNLYTCGGAVFPTSGCANPTYTMVALAIRLADTLKKQLYTQSV